MIESTSNNQLIGLIITFVVLALFFVVLIVYSLGGFKRSGSTDQKKKKWETFKADLNVGADVPAQQDAFPFDWTTPAAPVQASDQPPGGLLKSGGLRKAIEQKAEPSASVATNFSQPTSSAPEMTPLAFDLDARLNNLNGGSLSMAQPGPYQELFKVLFDPTTKQIVVEIDGEHFETIKQIKERAVGQRILEAVALLLKFTGGMVATTAGMKAFPVPEAKLTALPSGSPPPALSAEKPVMPTISPSPEPKPWSEPASQPQPASSDWFTKPAVPTPSQTTAEPAGGGAFSLFGKRNKPEEIPMLNFNLAAEIDNVLQQKLTAQGERTAVKIETGPGGGLRIRVGLDVFDSVDDVQPPAIRQLIQMSIKEWEKS